MQNVSYPYVVNNYTVWQVLPPPSDFEPDPTEPTEPTQETISPTGSTGNSTVVIIDPFTLPPEWLEDNAELDTDHYVLDSEQWEDPLKTITEYKKLLTLAEAGESDSSFWDYGQLIAPASIFETLQGLQTFIFSLFQSSGLLPILASLLVFGLIIRLISLK